MTDCVAFDLEGPLSPQDNAYELMKLFPNGGRIFEAISRYDDLLTLEERTGYEPGDTLSLIVPFLVCHGVTEADIAALAQKATLTGGAVRLIEGLQTSGWEVFCISTSYEHYALHIANRLGIYAQNVASTRLPLDEMLDTLCKDDSALLKEAERRILAINPDDDTAIKETLDNFFWEELPATTLGRLMAQVKAMGGGRKVAALEAFATKYDNPLSRWMVIGDSITDFKMLKKVDDSDGVAIAFNANEFALPYATMSLASTHIEDLSIVFQAWQKGRRGAVEKTVRARQKRGGKDDRGHFHWLKHIDNIEDVLKVHKKIRRLVREDAGKLG